MAGYSSLLDALNGGGAGQAGDEFQDGPFSDLFNLLGIRPMGYADRAQGAATPAVSASSAGGGHSAPAGAAPPPPGLGPYGTMPGVHDPITTTPLGPPGATPDPAFLAMLEQFLKQAPTATGVGPR